MQNIKMIAAVQASDFGIGYDLDLLFSIKEDLENFKKLSENHTVVMGRKTWDSLPNKFKPLPGRLNVVISKTAHIEGVVMKRNINSILQMAKEDPTRDIFIIGGGQLYREFLPFTSEIHLTTVTGLQNRVANVFFPKQENWQENYTLVSHRQHIGFDRIHKEEVTYSSNVYKNKMDIKF